MNELQPFLHCVPPLVRSPRVASLPENEPCKRVLPLSSVVHRVTVDMDSSTRTPYIEFQNDRPERHRTP